MEKEISEEIWSQKRKEPRKSKSIAFQGLEPGVYRVSLVEHNGEAARTVLFRSALEYVIILQRGINVIASDMNLYLRIMEKSTNCGVYEYWTDIPRFFLPAEWKVYIPNFFAQNQTNPKDKVFRPYFSSLDEDCNWSENLSSVTYLMLRIYDQCGGLIFEKEATLSANSSSGLSGAEVSWDGYIRCGSNAGINCDNDPCNPGGLCLIDGAPVSYPDEVYVWTLEIESVTNEACSLDCPCVEDLDNGVFCSSAQGKNCILTGDVTIWNHQ